MTSINRLLMDVGRTQHLRAELENHWKLGSFYHKKPRA